MLVTILHWSFRLSVSYLHVTIKINKNYNVTCCFVLIWNCVSNIKERKIEGVWEQGAEKNNGT
jgi:hypothetical protein